MAITEATLTVNGRIFVIRAEPMGSDWTTGAARAAVSELLPGQGPDGRDTSAEWDGSGITYTGVNVAIAESVRDILDTLSEDE